MGGKQLLLDTALREGRKKCPISLSSPHQSPASASMGKLEQERDWVMQSAKVGFQGTEQGKKRMENTSKGQRIRCTMSLSKVGKLNH